MLDSLTKDQLLAVLRAARAQGTRNWTMILCAFSHGLRASEVCGLRMGDLVDGHLRIARLKNSHSTLHQLMPHRGEPLLDEVKALKTWLAERPTDAGDALFPSQMGGCMSRAQFFNIYKAAARDAGLPAHLQHPHCLKHACVTTLIQQGMNLAVVARYVGHASISSTMRYTHVSDTTASSEAMATLQRM
jgi:type 1 fimbriae regulatory protein FimB